MPSNLYKRGTTWWARVQVQGKDHRRSLRTSSRAEAVKRLRAFMEEAGHQRFYDEERRTWKTAVAEWGMHGTAGIKPGTLKRYQVSLRQLRPYLENLYVDEIGRKKIAEIARRAVVSNATRRRDLTAVSVVLRFTVAQGWRDDNPARDWDRSVISERRDPIVLPDRADIDLVVSLAPGNFAGLIRLAQHTGMRQNEIVTLERRQVRLAARRLDLWKSKTNRPRTLWLDDSAVGTLDGTLPSMACTFVFWHPDDEDGAAPYANVSSRFRQIVLRARNLAEKEKRTFRPFRFHDLRHWYAVDYLRGGGNIYDLQKQLGHKSIKTTEMYLDYLDAGEQRQAKFGVGTGTGTDITVSGDDDAE